ncbi:uncharacterized protein METZ01_LOCUS362619 [marine metagenome]|uniref:Uncharacterized protein n=1 Tax=marine metagenome TaxID=408172 RepID=A0A382SJV5_9ZZZZ
MQEIPFLQQNICRHQLSGLLQQSGHFQTHQLASLLSHCLCSENSIVATEDADEVRGKIKELQQIVFDDVPYIFLNFRNHRTARRSYVKNFQTGKLKGREDIRRVWIDK